MNLSLLNQTQKEAVTFKIYPLMVIAGAGSGKTLVLTYRVAYLIREGIKPSQLFITTFTVKAADEMLERLKSLIGERQTDRLNIGTFHSLCFRIYKDILDSKDDGYGYPRIIKGGSRFMTMVSIINNYKINSDNNKFSTKDVKYLLSKISYFKNNGITVEDLDDQTSHLFTVSHEGTGLEKYSSELTEYLAYRDYEQKLNERNMIDFDDMLLKTYVLLSKSENKEILKSIRNKISHILVDEAQDLNVIQHMLLDILSGKNKGLTLVLDDWQSIYKFRNVQIQSIFDFISKYKAEVIKLEQNYRSTKSIVEYGNKLIKNNKNQIEKTLFTKNEEGSKARFSLCLSVEDEALNIVDEIKLLQEDGCKLNDIAILYRVNAQSRAIVDQLILNDINHKVYSNQGFYDRPEVKDIVSYIKILNDPYEAELSDFKRIINKPKRFLGAKFINEVEELQLSKDYETFWHGLKNVHNTDLRNYQISAGLEFVDQIENLHDYIKKNDLNVTQVIELILGDIGYKAWVTKDNDNTESEPDNDVGMNIDSLLVGANRFNNLDDFIMYVNSFEYNDNDLEKDYMHVMTIHKSKGMEFSNVFVIGMSTKLMPHMMSKSDDDEEEERRIAYVAITRSKKQLYISSIKGKFNRLNVDVSPFVSELGLYNIDKNEVVKEKKVVLRKKNQNEQIEAIQNILG